MDERLRRARGAPEVVEQGRPVGEGDEQLRDVLPRLARLALGDRAIARGHHLERIAVADVARLGAPFDGFGGCRRHARLRGDWRSAYQEANGRAAA